METVADVTDLKLLQFTRIQKVDATFHLLNKQVNNCYSFILGRDLCQNSGLDVLNSQKAFLWDGIQVNIVPRGYWTQAAIKGCWDHEDKERKEEAESKEERLKAKYKKTDLQETADSLKHLTSDEQEVVFEVLKKYEVAFQGTRGNWNGKPIELELKEGTRHW